MLNICPKNNGKGHSPITDSRPVAYEIETNNPGITPDGKVGREILRVRATRRSVICKLCDMVLEDPIDINEIVVGSYFSAR